MKARKTLAAGVLSAATAATLVLSGGPAGALPHLGTATANPNSNLVNGQTVTVTVSGFAPSDQQLFAAECSSKIASTQNEQQSCDTAHITATTPGQVTNGAGSFPFTVLAGAAFVDGAHDKCDYSVTACYIVVSDSETDPTASTSYAGLASISFKDTRSTDTTKVKASHKSVKKGKKDTFTATTTKAAAAAGGKVVFKFGSHKKTVKETATGKVKATFKVKKSGTVSASFSGNSSYKPSHGKVKVKVKK